eukprot:CAMPEP_0177715218 /NCGR_PEP_ID=MMETSP0484_2-20121128/13876_1 /TAXON_ID=354590 /ORGANISM="Rhodomonas lens, Strain RHODO" /LENGTH=86 /DNA_ID=CAMNT_0019227201 /DNA_START=116 /DNA_END=374 /DNA_ORIENTATION=+
MSVSHMARRVEHAGGASPEGRAKAPPVQAAATAAQGGQGSIDANSGRQGSGVDWSALRFVELGEDVTECDVTQNMTRAVWTCAPPA